MMQELKSFDPKRCPVLDDLVGAYSLMVGVKASYETLGIDEPKWLGNKITAVEKQVADLKKARVEKEIARLEARYAKMVRDQETVGDLEAKIAELKASLEE